MSPKRSFRDLKRVTLGDLAFRLGFGPKRSFRDLKPYGIDVEAAIWRLVPNVPSGI